MTAKRKDTKATRARKPEQNRQRKTGPVKKSGASNTEEEILVPPHINPKWAKYYKRLVQLREQLLNQKRGLAQVSAMQVQSYGLHMADSGTDNFDRDFALSLMSNDQDIIYEIDEAIRRIENNTYGICELTGKPIPKARLDAIPWARFTVEAQAQLEREGSLRYRPRLRPLGIVETTSISESENQDTELELDKE